MGFEGIPIKSISCGSAFSAVLSEDNELWTWGHYDGGQCGNPYSHQLDYIKQESIPIKIDGFENIPLKSIDCGSKEMAVVSTSNHLYKWGNGVHLTPYRIEGDNKMMLKIKFTDVSVGNGYGFALDEEGHIFSWGAGGQLGLGHRQNIQVPQAIVGFGSSDQDNLGKAIKIFSNIGSNTRVAAIVEKPAIKSSS